MPVILTCVSDISVPNWLFNVICGDANIILVWVLLSGKNPAIIKSVLVNDLTASVNICGVCKNLPTANVKFCRIEILPPEFASIVFVLTVFVKLVFPTITLALLVIFNVVLFIAVVIPSSVKFVGTFPAVLPLTIKLLPCI